MSKYYAAIGNPKASIAYMDSTVLQHITYRKQYSPSRIFQAEKKLLETNKQLTEKHLEAETLKKLMYRNLFFTFLLIVSLLIGFYIVYERIRTQKNRGLYRQIKEKDQLIKQFEELKLHSRSLPQRHVQGNTRHQILFDKFHAYLLQDKNFTNPDIDYIKIAAALTTNKTYLYDAVKVVSGKSPIEYINGLRIEETRKMLEIRSDYSITLIASECGFNSYRTFQRFFRKTYRLRPVEYRKIAQTEQVV